MPTNLVKKYAHETGKSVSEVERLWDRAKEIALKKFKKKDAQYYSYVVGILKNMLSLNSVLVYDLRAMAAQEEPIMLTDDDYEEDEEESPKKRSKATKRTAWERLGRKSQESYLKKHPRSKKKITIDVHLEQKEKEEEEPTDINNVTPAQEQIVHEHVDKSLTRINHLPEHKKELLKHLSESVGKIKNMHKLSPVAHARLKMGASVLMGLALGASMIFLPIQPFSLHLASAYIDSLGQPSRFRGGYDEDSGAVDEEGNLIEPPIVDEEGNVIPQKKSRPKLDEHGNPILKLDEEGKPIPKLDEDGNPIEGQFEQEEEEEPPAEEEEEPPAEEEEEPMQAMGEVPELDGFTDDERQHIQEMAHDMTDWVLENPDEKLREAQRRKEFEESKRKKEREA